MNKLMDILVDDEKNDELVDMIADTLVNKLMGAVLPQSAQAIQFPAAEIRPMMPQMMRGAQFSAPMQAPPLVNVAYDNSKNVKLGENREGVMKTRNKNYNSVKDSPSARWGSAETIKGG